MELHVSFDVWDAATDPMAAERNLIRVAWATWRNKTLQDDFRKHMAWTLLKSARANRAAGGVGKKAQASVHRALNLTTREGRKTNYEAEKAVYWLIRRHIERTGKSRDRSIVAFSKTPSAWPWGFNGASLENLRRIMREWEKAQCMDC